MNNVEKYQNLLAKKTVWDRKLVSRQQVKLNTLRLNSVGVKQGLKVRILVKDQLGMLPF